MKHEGYDIEGMMEAAELKSPVIAPGNEPVPAPVAPEGGQA